MGIERRKVTKRPAFWLAPLVAVSLAACGSSGGQPAHDGVSTVRLEPAATTTRPTKVLVVVEENKSTSQALSGMPYLESLGKKYGYTTNYRAVTHPSEPNYLAIAGGSTFGISDDRYPAANSAKIGSARTVFDQAIARGRTAKTYAQSMPSNCYLTNAYPYAVKHNPWAFFASSASRAHCRSDDVSTSGLLTAAQNNRLPNVGMVVPNLTRDAHDGTLAQADGYLKQIMPPILNSADFRSGRLAVVITFDEASDGAGSNAVLAVVCDANLSGKVVSTPLTHYGLSRWLSETVGAEPLKQAATATDMRTAFGL